MRRAARTGCWKIGPPRHRRSRQPPRPEPGGLPELRFGEVELVDGKISYFGARSGVSYEVNRVNVEVQAPDLARPAVIKGKLVFRRSSRHYRQPHRSAARPDRNGCFEADSGRDRRSGFGPVRWRLAEWAGRTRCARHARPQRSGSAQPGDLGDRQGRRRTCRYRTLPCPERWKRMGSGWRLTGGTYKAGDIEATGNVGLGLAGPRPRIDAVLSLARLHLDQYLNQSGGQPPNRLHSHPPRRPQPHRRRLRHRSPPTGRRMAGARSRSTFPACARSMPM